MSHELPEACEALGFPRATANDCRRTHGSRLAASGVAHSLIGKALGHEGPQMAYKVYGHLSPEELGAAIDRQSQVGTPVSQSPVDGGVCEGGEKPESSCFSEVAPPGVEPGRPEGPGILNPIAVIDWDEENAFWWRFSRENGPQNIARYRSVRTRTSHSVSPAELELLSDEEAGRLQ